MSFKIFEVRHDLRISPVRSRGGIEYIVSDPARSTSFKVGYLQYAILRFLQSRSATAEEVDEYLISRCGVEVGKDQIEKLLSRFRERSLLEPSREDRLSSFQRALLSSTLKEKLQAMFRKIGSRQTMSDEELLFVSEVFYQVKRGDLVAALDGCRKAQSALNDKTLPTHMAGVIREAIIQNRFSLDEQTRLSRGTKQYPLINPEKILRKIRPFLFLLVSPMGAVVGTVLFLCALTVSISHRTFLIFGMRDQIALILSSNWFLLFFIMCITKTVHEFGHAGVCYRFGGRVRRMGFMVFLGIFPNFFADVTDTYFMPLGKRVLVMAGGVMAELLLWSVTVILWAMTPEGTVLHAYLTLAGVLTGVEALFNLLPIFKLDGYYILGDLIGIENLFDRSFTYCRLRIKKILGFMTDTAQEMKEITSYEARWFWIYASTTFISLAWQIMMGQYVLTITFEDIQPIVRLGFSVILVGAVLRFAMLGWRGAKSLFSGKEEQERRPFVVTKRSYIALAVVVGVLMVPVPYKVYAPAILAPSTMEVVRSRSDGVVRDVRVHQGESVRPDDNLIVISSPTLDTSYQRELVQHAQLRSEVDAVLSGPTMLDRQLEDRRLDTANAKYRGHEESFRLWNDAREMGLAPSIELFLKRQSLDQEMARVDFARATREVKLAFPPQELVEIRRRSLEMSSLKLKTLHEEVSGLRINASTRGVVTTRDPKRLIGLSVKKGDELLQIAGRDLLIDMKVLEEEMEGVELGHSVTFAPVVYAPLLKGSVSLISAVSIPQTKQKRMSHFPPPSIMRVRANIHGQVPEELRIGDSGNAKISVGRRPLGFVLFRKLWRAAKVTFWATF